MLKIYHLLLDQIFPPRKYERMVRGLKLEDLLSHYEVNTYHGTLCLLPYQTLEVTAVINENKFYRNEKAARLLAEVLKEWLQKQSASYVLIPIPLGKKRFAERGYNQVTEILNSLPTNPNFLVDDSLLGRKKDTPPQTSLPRTARLRNIVGAFVCPHPEKLQTYANTTIVIIDDVSTTGSTLQVARATLAPYLPPNTSLVCLALAH